MTDPSGGMLIARALRKHGVKFVFNGVALDMSPVQNACLDEGMELINVRHEAAAAYMAHGYARATRQTGVCIVHTGPGALNITTPIAAAFYECSPVLAICGHTSQDKVDNGANHEFDAIRVFEQFIKFGRICTDGTRFGDYVNLALRHANVGRPGPVVLEFPTSLMANHHKEASMQFLNDYDPISPPAADPRAVKETAELLRVSSHPVILAGNGVYWSDASADIKELAEFAGIPVVTRSGQAQGCIPEDHPLSFGVLTRGPNSALGKADFILAIGIQFDAATTVPPIAAGVKVVQVDIDLAELGRYVNLKIGICSDAKQALSQIVNEVKYQNIRKNTEWLKEVREDMRKSEQELPGMDELSKSNPISHVRLVKEIKDFLPKDSWFVYDGATIAGAARRIIKAYYPGRIISAYGNLGNMGAGVPFTIGVKIAHPDKPVLLLEGDGSFLFNSRELETAQRHGINFVCVIGNDRAWGAEHYSMANAFGESQAAKMGTLLSGNTRYDKYAESLGCYGELVTDATEIVPALKRCYESGKPSVLDVRIFRRDMYPDNSRVWGYTLRGEPVPR
ncbi:MAG: thiamine pyrophosphate-binding protein [Nitrososphaerota archaeon]|nr:thiamine pyrophosphate-binding protein [Nitrososphaerota archaeon]